MSGRIKSLSAKSRPLKAKKPNAPRQRQLAARQRKAARQSPRMELLKAAAKAQGK